MYKRVNDLYDTPPIYRNPLKKANVPNSMNLRKSQKNQPILQYSNGGEIVNFINYHKLDEILFLQQLRSFVIFTIFYLF